MLCARWVLWMQPSARHSVPPPPLDDGSAQPKPRSCLLPSLLPSQGLAPPPLSLLARYKLPSPYTFHWIKYSERCFFGGEIFDHHVAVFVRIIIMGLSNVTSWELCGYENCPRMKPVAVMKIKHESTRPLASFSSFADNAQREQEPRCEVREVRKWEIIQLESKWLFELKFRMFWS